MKRTISKRLELNPSEDRVLRMKAGQTGLSEADYLRELLMNSQPVEAPPRQFYEKMEEVNQIGGQIQQILQRAGDTLQPEELAQFRLLYYQLIELLVSIKQVVSSARYYSPRAYECWLHEVRQAKKEGREPPKIEDYDPRDSTGDIRRPAEDPDLGWNALGIVPSFLEEELRREDGDV